MCGPETPNIHLQKIDTIKKNLILFTDFHLLLLKMHSFIMKSGTINKGRSENTLATDKVSLLKKGEQWDYMKFSQLYWTSK